MLAVQLRDRHGLPAVGAHVLATLTGRVLVRDQVAGGSYSSRPQIPCSYFGLGSEGRIDRLDVEWPWGSVETWQPGGRSAASSRCRKGGQLSFPKPALAERNAIEAGSPGSVSQSERTSEARQATPYADRRTKRSRRHAIEASQFTQLAW